MYISWIPSFGYVWELNVFTWEIQYWRWNIEKGWKPYCLKTILTQLLSFYLPTLNNLIMVFTVALATALFCGTNQMGLENNARVSLVDEGIISVNNLAEFRKNHWHQVVKNLKYLASLTDLDYNGQFIWAPTITLGAKPLECLKVASESARYFEATGCPLTPGSMNFTTTLWTFELQWWSLCDRSNSTPPSVLNITRNVKVMKWASSMPEFWGTVIGVQNTPLAYIVLGDRGGTYGPPPHSYPTKLTPKNMRS